MITISGVSLSGGVAVAVAATLDSRKGIDGLSHDLLQSGLDALRTGLSPSDFAEAVVACDKLEFGLSFGIPGVRKIAIAAESGNPQPDHSVEAPCVTDLPDLVASVSHGDILIVDGDRGLVHIDPDLQTLILYQQIELEKQDSARIHISSDHLPAKTQSGEVVNIYAQVSSVSDVEAAVEHGADGLVADVRGVEMASEELYRDVLGGAEGKRIFFILDFLPRSLVRQVTHSAAPWQVTLVLPGEQLEDRLAEALAEMEAAETEAFFEDLQPPQLGFAASACHDSALTSAWAVERVFVDVRHSVYLEAGAGDLRLRLIAMAPGGNVEGLVLMAQGRLPDVEQLVSGGARNIVVGHLEVSAAKYAVRCVGAEEEP